MTHLNIENDFPFPNHVKPMRHFLLNKMHIDLDLYSAIGFITDPLQEPYFSEESETYHEPIESGLEYHQILADNFSVPTGQAGLVGSDLILFDGIDRSGSLPKCGKLCLLASFPKYFDYAKLSFTDQRITDRFLNVTNAVNWNNYPGNEIVDINVAAQTNFGYVYQITRKKPVIDFLNLTGIPIPPNVPNIYSSLIDSHFTRGPLVIPNQTTVCNYVRVFASALHISYANLRFYYNITTANVPIDESTALLSVQMELYRRTGLFLALPDQHTNLPTGASLSTIKHSNWYVLSNIEETSGGTSTIEVPRRQQFRRKILEAAQPYNGMTNDEINDLAKRRNWSPEICHYLKKALCSENVSCFNLEFGQEYGSINTTMQQQQFKAPTLNCPPTHLPIEHPLYINTLLLTPNLPNQEKEYLHPHYGWTEQFKHERPFQSIFPTHQQKDYATRKWSLEYRVKFATTKTNVEQAKLTQRKAMGSALFLNFVKYLELPEQQFDDAEFYDCISENTTNRLKKPLVNLFNIKSRGDLGLDHNTVHLFLKSQICKKLEKMYAKAKPGQIISNLHVIILILMAPIIRYMHRVIENHIAKTGHKLYFNGRRNIDELDAFVRANIDPNLESTTNDFTMFDQSQDVEFLHFQILLMKHLHVPQFFIDYYFHYKTHLESQHGPIAVMIFSGEPPTWHFNTYDNLAWTTSV
ncbi:3304_t:CDS:2 [Cetraspora pellucida]|uniref:3304_t:CDS:1 n=1 Tax=Cetraspora pellucida TaxID=1433469 RepID=A0ACA9KSR4_9GLOM|nr:3304_t:CDS:2 [Cetraspora pellucida]